MNLPRFSVNNPVVVHLLLLGIVAFGLVAAARVRRELLPDTTPDAIRVSARYPGASPAEVESAVVLPLEEVLQAVEGVEVMRSAAREGQAEVTLTLEKGADPEYVLRDVDAELENVRNLPEEVIREGLSSRAMEPHMPAISVAVHGSASLDRLRRATEDLEDALLRDPLISRTQVLGIPEREVSIRLDPRRLDSLELKPEDIARIISDSHLDEPAGVMRGAFGETLVRSLGRRSSLLELENLPIVNTADGGLVRLRDLAEIEIVWVEPLVTGRFDGQPAARIAVFRTGDEDVIAIAHRVREIADARPVEAGITYTPHNDLSRHVDDRIDLMTRNGRTGLLLVFLSLAFFLSFRLSFWVAVGIPVSFLGTLIVMGLVGLTLNLITLFGLIVVLGMIVDDAIVIGENVYRHFEEGLSAEEAAIKGTSEVTWPVVAAVLTSIAAFLPLMMIEGRFGDVIRPLPLVVSVALLVSLVEALVLLPRHLASSLSRTKKRHKFILHRWTDAALKFFLNKFYTPVLRVLLQFRYLTVLALFCLSTISVAVGVYVVPFHLAPDAEADAIFCALELPVGEPLARTEEIVVRLEEMCRREVPELKHIYTLVGFKLPPNSLTSSGTGSLGTHYAQINLELLGAEHRTRGSAEILSALRRLTNRMPGLKSSSWNAESGNPTGPDIEIEVRGDGATVDADVARLEAALALLSGVQDIRTDAEPGKPEVRLHLNHYGRVLGLTERGLAAQVRGALHGLVASTWHEADGQIDIIVRYVSSSLETRGQLEGLFIYTPAGDKLPLREVADLEERRGQGVLNRVDRKRATSVFGSVNHKQTSSLKAVEDLQSMSGLEGIDLRYRGEQFESQKSMGSLWVVTLVASVLIYVILAVVFRSYVQPLIVMGAIPFAVNGIIFGHLLLGMEISFMSMIGVVALFGIVVNDSLILVDFINLSRREGRRLLDSVVSAAKKRVRPIVLTSLTTVAGLAPLMTETSFQARFIIPMAVSLSFGLVFATVLTLVAIPCMYLMLDDVRQVLAAKPPPAASPKLKLKLAKDIPDGVALIRPAISGEGPAFAGIAVGEERWDDGDDGAADVELSGEFDFLLDETLDAGLASQVLTVPADLLGGLHEPVVVARPPELAAELEGALPVAAVFGSDADEADPEATTADLTGRTPPLPARQAAQDENTEAAPTVTHPARSERAQRPGRPRRPRRAVQAAQPLRKRRMLCPGCGNRVKFASGREGTRVKHSCGAKFTLRAALHLD